MPGHRRVVGRGRRTRISLVAAALAATGVFVGGTAALGGVFGEQTVASSDAAKGDAAPASVPEHDTAPQVASIPKGDPANGMVYTGLKAAPKGDRCAGVLSTAGGECTHGPDAPPKGVDISKDTAPAVKADLPAVDPGRPSPTEPSATGPAADAAAPALDAQAAQSAPSAAASAPPAATQKPGTAVAAAAGESVVCDGDGSTGNRIQVVYAHGPGRDRYAQYVASFRKWAADADTIYFASAQETGGVRHIRFVTAADCSPTVIDVELPDASMAEFSAMNSALAQKGFNRKDRKYMVFADTNVYCGIGTFNGDERPGQDNLSNFGPSYGRTDSGCWSGATAAHELGHNLGAVNNSAPNSSKGAHCTDEWDIMCYSDTPYYPQMRTVCPDRGHDERLDCNHDDYFNTAPKPGSYLATHWNIANNQFLMTGNGTKPDPEPTPTPDPTSSPTPTPKPSPTGSTGPSGGPNVTVGQVAPDSAVAGWQPVASAAWYQVLLNGSHAGWVQQTSVRLYNLRPDTDYTVAVSVRDASGHDSGPGRTASFHTPKAGGTSTTPAGVYTLTNGATGLAAAVWGGRTADNTVLVGSQATGYADQQWHFDDAGSGFVRIRSAVSGKCLQLGGAPAVGQWVAQQPCAGTSSQQWRLASAAGGVTVTAKDSSLVLSVGNRPYYGARLLELQDPGAAGFHTWTLQKVS